MRIDLDRVPRRATGMVPYEVMLSESQERMLVIARPGQEAAIERVFARWELHGERIGEVIAAERLEISSGGLIVASLPPKTLADDAPEYDVREWAAAPERSALPTATIEEEILQAEGLRKIGLELLELLASPDVASRAILYRTYDQMVGTDTVLGPGADAAIMRIKGRPDGIAIALDAQPRTASLDPFVGAAAAVAEATRNVVCVGAEPRRDH